MSSADLPVVPSVPGSVVAIAREQDREVRWLDQAAFVFPDDPGHELDYFEWDRTFGVRADDGELVGVNSTYSLRVVLPTGELGTGTVSRPMAGLSWVSVHPGYRRRGVLSAMMRHHLHEVHARGEEALSGLHASEASIYPRFGYGLATVGYAVSLGRGLTLRDAPAAPDDEGLRVRFATADVEAHGALVADLYTRSCARRPGMVDRTAALNRGRFRQTPRELEKEEPLRILVADREGRPTGYALVQRDMKWTDHAPDGTTRVLELAATDVVTERRLWQAVADFDLTSATIAYRVATDHPLLAWLPDARTIKPTRTDELFLRVVDLDRALTSRGYAIDVDVVLAVTDGLCPWNAGTWRLVGAADGATCERTNDAPDLTLDVRELGAALPGGASLAAAGAAGLVQEHTPGALARLSTAMRSAIEPATTYGF
ncbi:GNAT family N-acetyltransferase [Angustibacter luteus]|uniref:GNAT family N-acetyltransferase n=1 Tax=Angustibacter luteus TaxID=658456 RepID=A0ABW1JJ89_9ACTN